MIPAGEALARLRDGNRRFVSGVADPQGPSSYSWTTATVGGQQPFAIVLGCSDSRVPAEIVFDQGLGDLFVIRVAGNVVKASQTASVEFAATQFGTRLVVVLGHSRCGAVIATVETVRRSAEEHPGSLGVIIDCVRPSVESVMASEPAADDDRLVDLAVRANIEASVDQLRHGSGILSGLVEDEGLVIVGAEYSLTTGEVDFL